eukprot:CCRYP_000358-RA/>CCRYP_000358-RA protein AED:0.01 eAED:0.01 QI:1097/1/1/1/0.75/0.66/9/214/1028
MRTNDRHFVQGASKYQRDVLSGARYSEDPLDQAQEEQNQNRQVATAAEFRNKKNFTQTMIGNMTAIMDSTRFGVGQIKERYGRGDMTSIRQKQKQQKAQRQQQQQQRQVEVKRQSPWDRKPKKKPSEEDDHEVVDDSMHHLSEIISFNDAIHKSPNHSSVSAECPIDTIWSIGKRKKRECVVDSVEIVASKRHSKDQSEKRVTNEDRMIDEEMVEVDETNPNEEGDIREALHSCDRPLSTEEIELVRTPNERRGRSYYDYNIFDLEQSPLERESKRKPAPWIDADPEEAIEGVSNLKLTRANNGSSVPKKKPIKGKSQVFGTKFRQKDDIENADHWKITEYRNENCNNSPVKNTKNSKRDDPTRKLLKQSGMAVQTPTCNDDWVSSSKCASSDDEWTNRSKDKKKSSPKHRKIVSSSTTSRRITRSHAEPQVGATEENAITIDSDTDDSSAGDIGVESSPTIQEDKEVSSQETQKRITRAAGDLASIDVARIAIGEKVFRSKCALKFQWGTKAPYLLFAFSTGGSQFVNIKVHLQGEELNELAYFIAEDDEKGVPSDKFDDSMSIVAFCVRPSRDNTLDRFSDCYDGETEGKQYIAIEVRDKEEFQSMLKQMKEHPDLRAFCMDACLEYYNLAAYTKALVNDDKVEREKRHSIPRTRSRGTNKALSSENKLLVVYPFKVEEEILQSISSKLTELSGHRLGVAEATESASETDDLDEGNDDGNEQEGQARDTSTRTHYLTIREDDKERLQPGQFLNDTLVDFWMSWISRNKSHRDSNDVHFFTSHFLTTLEDEGPRGVASWTLRKKRKINVFKKKLIFVPVNGDMHWSLCVIVNPGLILKTDEGSDTDDNEDDEWPCILFLDSLRMHRKERVAKRMREWLNFEWNRSMKDTEGFRPDPFSREQMKLVTPKVPYQENGCDCGVFVCRYAYNLYTMRSEKFTRSGIRDKFKHLITDGPAFQFNMDDIARIREELKTLVDALAGLYSKFKREEKELKMAAKQQTHAQNEAVDQEEKENSPQQKSDHPEECAL